MVATMRGGKEGVHVSRATMIPLCALMLMPALAFAQARPWVQVGGGFSTHAMGDVNDLITQLNNESNVGMDKVNKGYSINGALGVDITPKIAVGASYDRLLASSELKVLGVTYKWDLPANHFRAFGQYTLVKNPKNAAFLEAGVGLINASGKETLSGAGSSDINEERNGTAVTFDAALGGEYNAMTQMSIVGTIGYRYAKIGEVKDQADRVLYLPDGTTKATLDYSGLAIRAGLKFWFMK